VALGTINISTGAVNTELGSPYTTPRIVRNLCIHANVNPCSFGRPGLWDIDGTGDRFIFFQKPRGSGYTDPRGSYNGTDKESYHLGDFRLYNNSAVIPYCDFPATTIEYPSGTTVATPSVTIYVGEMDWKQTLPEHYSENDWPTLTNIHLLDASDDTIVGTAAIPSSGGNVSIQTSILMAAEGGTYSETYHVAFGIDATHWSIKMGSDQGLGGIGTITVKRLQSRQIQDVIYVGTVTGGVNPVYDNMRTYGATTESFSGTNVARWEFFEISPFEARRSGYPTFFATRIDADWLIKGFKDEPDAEYIVKTAQVYGNNANNDVTLPAGGLTRSGGGANSPNQFGDGDNIVLLLENIDIIF